MLQDQLHQTKWGFVPCDFEKYKFFKELNLRCFQDVRAVAARDRWHRKEPQNRVIRKWIRNTNGQKIDSVVIGPRTEPSVSGLWKYRCEIERAYYLARYPDSKEKAILASKEIEEIEKQLNGKI